MPLPLLSDIPAMLAAGTAEGLLQADAAVQVQVRAHGDEEDLSGRAEHGVGVEYGISVGGSFFESSSLSV